MLGSDEKHKSRYLLKFRSLNLKAYWKNFFGQFTIKQI
jgi:hypothetical protein